jgi:hypothetical protein
MSVAFRLSPAHWPDLSRVLAVKSVRPCSPLEFAALLYLGLPLVVFFLTFTRVVVAVPAIAAIAVSLYRVHPAAPLRTGIAWGALALSGVLAAAYLWACGYAPPAGRSWDWLKHFAIINELGQHPWPVIREDTQTFLRYYLGYYMVPGLATKLFGNRYIETFVFLQTWLGLLLILALLLEKIQPKRPGIFILLFLLFSGLDIFGSALFDDRWSLLKHKEWWAGLGVYAYEGHATLFLWVPQHALAGLLGVAVTLPHGDRQPPAQMFGLLAASVLFWSPFAALGLAPFLIAAALRSGAGAFFDPGNIASGVVIGVPLVAYLLTGAGGVPQGFNNIDDANAISLFALFLFLEVGAYLIALRLCCWNRLHFPVVVMAVLGLLPLYRIGLYNDLTMRACIPAIALIGIAASAAASEARSYACVPLVILMLLGSATSVLEIIGRGQDGHVPARQVTLRSGFLTDDPRYFVQYNAPLPHWVLPP